jgi:hypothetical protein
MNFLLTVNTGIFGMFVQAAGLSECFATLSTGVVPLACVDRHVLAQVPLVLEPFATQLAHKPGLFHTTTSKLLEIMRLEKTKKRTR